MSAWENRAGWNHDAWWRTPFEQPLPKTIIIYYRGACNSCREKVESVLEHLCGTWNETLPIIGSWQSVRWYQEAIKFEAGEPKKG